MTDERLCACPLYIQTVSQFTCPAHGLVRNGEPVEAAPSTDEGEARQVADITHNADLGGSWWEYRLPHWTTRRATTFVPSQVEAAIRAPLEERIRELTGNLEGVRIEVNLAYTRVGAAEARAVRSHELRRAAEAGELRARDAAARLGRARWEEKRARLSAEERIRELEAERDEAYEQGFSDGGNEPGEAIEEYKRQNERLREALRPHVDEVMDVRREAAFRYPTGPLGQSPVHIAHVYDRRESFEAGWLTGLAKLRALATPPSSTEGGK